ncbi:MAG: histidinol-phosphatase HisJ family protein [Candidatus Edwardsbacteria bacterium]|nr:histidinol-phosphatase HisJ family protein [Candidatus Edwardsbacteria bacterium]
MNPDISAYPLGAIDAHVHSKHSCDSDMEPQDAVDAAEKAGLKAIVLTEHVDFDPTDGGYGFYDGEAILKTFSELSLDFARDKRITNSELKIFKGVEITYQPQYESEIREFIHARNFDFVIGSIHLVGPDDISWPEKQERYFSSRTEEEAYGAYFDAVQKLVDSRLFDCLGHLDLCKKFGFNYYGPMEWEKYKTWIQRILQSLIQTDMYLELNSSGLRQAPKESYPSVAVIKEYLNLGGKKLTLGSDAHVPEHVGYCFPEICEILNAEYRMQNAVAQ